MVKEKVKTVKKTKKKATKRTKISWIVKPDGMSLTEWQIALRKQIAQEEHFRRIQREEPKDEAGVQGSISRCEERVELLLVL